MVRLSILLKRLKRQVEEQNEKSICSKRSYFTDEESGSEILIMPTIGYYYG
jgi:hypothetical protein